MILAGLAAATLALPAVVAPPTRDTCLTYDSAYAAAPLMTVRPGGRVYLQDKAQPCAPGKTCAFVRKAYLVPGDVVLASQPRSGFRCIYAGAGGRLWAGFVPDAALTPAPAYGPLDPKFLVGRWIDGEDHLSFKLAKGRLVVDGDAIWPGSKPPKGVPASRFAPNIGEVAGAVRIAGSRFEVGDPEEECRVWGYRRGPYLVVQDNENCGGMNVRFQGVYVRTGGS